MHTPILLLCLFLLAPLAAQMTWTVTSPTGVQAALDAASPGDILLLPNTGGFPDYEPFAVFKGVTIRGNGCRIGASATATVHTLVVSVPVGQRAHLDGLDLTYSFNPQFGNVGLPLQVSGGTLTVRNGARSSNGSCPQWASPMLPTCCSRTARFRKSEVHSRGSASLQPIRA